VKHKFSFPWCLLIDQHVIITIDPMHVLQPMALVDDVLVLVLGSSLAN
jgi:hypothetical protein